ncbi:Hypothetical predicted protein, partial [Scomber scombrus]
FIQDCETHNSDVLDEQLMKLVTGAADVLQLDSTFVILIIIIIIIIIFVFIIAVISSELQLRVEAPGSLPPALLSKHSDEFSAEQEQRGHRLGC